MTKDLSTIEPSPTYLAQQSSVPQGLAITQDVRLRQAQAEMMSRMQMALVLPRSWEAVGSKLLAACDNPDFAREAYYSKPAGRDNIEGLSIRFAELAHRIMRNIAIDTTPENEDDLSVHYRMTVTDLESNTPSSETFKVEKTVERRGVRDGDTVLSQRTNASGEKVFLIPATEDQLNTKLRAQAAKVRRTLILAMVPAEIKVQCLAKCKKIANDSDAKDPAGPSKSIIGAFLSIGIEVSDLKEYLGKSPASTTAKEVEGLRGIYSLLRDGEMTWADVMDAKRERDQKKGSAAAFVAEKQKQRAGRKPAAAKPEAQAAAPKKPRGAQAAQSPAGGTAAPAGAATPPAEPTKPRTSRRDDDDDDAPDSSPPSSQP